MSMGPRIPPFTADLPRGGIMSQIFAGPPDVTVVSLSGYAQSGKDSVALTLIENGFQKIAFADALRSACYVLNPWVPIHGGERYYQLQTVVDLLGWDQAKGHPEVRRLLQVMGTEVGRQIVGENVWVDTLKRRLEPGNKYVVTDTRFPNEFQALRELGAKMVRINRPGVGPVNNHKSETAIDTYEYDIVIANDQGLEELAKAALVLL